jgi:hypothetical protein
MPTENTSSTLRQVLSKRLKPKKLVSIRQISGSYLDNQIDAKRIPEFAGISERIVPAIAKLADSGGDLWLKEAQESIRLAGASRLDENVWVDLKGSSQPLPS